MEEFECEVCGSLVFVSPDQAKVVCQNCLSEYCKEGLNPGEAVTHLESSVVRSFEVVPAPFTVWDQTFDPPPEATHVLALRTLVPMPWWLLGPAIDAALIGIDWLAYDAEFIGWEGKEDVLVVWVKEVASPIAWKAAAAVVIAALIIVGIIIYGIHWFDLRKREVVLETIRTLEEVDADLDRALAEGTITREEYERLTAWKIEVVKPPPPAIPWELIIGGLVAIVGMGVIIHFLRK